MMPTSAQTVGYFQMPSQVQGPVAITVNDYGAGRAIWMGFNLLMEAMAAGPDSIFASLLLHALADLQPPVPLTWTRAVVPIHLSVRSQASMTSPIQALVRIPPETAVVAVETTAGLVIPQEAEELDWVFIPEAEKSAGLTFWLRLPKTPGAVEVNTIIQTSAEAGNTELDRLNLQVDVVQPPGLSEALALLDQLATPEPYTRYTLTRSRLQSSAHFSAPPTRVLAWAYMLLAVDSLSKSNTVEAKALRFMISEALRQVYLQAAED
jgi:hypothetical protein